MENRQKDLGYGSRSASITSYTNESHSKASREFSKGDRVYNGKEPDTRAGKSKKIVRFVCCDRAPSGVQHEWEYKLKDKHPSNKDAKTVSDWIKESDLEPASDNDE